MVSGQSAIHVRAQPNDRANHKILCTKKKSGTDTGEKQKLINNKVYNEVKFIDRDPHWYTRRVKETIHIRLHPNNINMDSGIEILEAWMPTIKKHNNKRTVQQRAAEVTTTRRNNGEPKCTNHSRPS